MKRRIVYITLLLLVAAFSFCRSNGGNGRGTKPEIPPEMKRNGMISSSTYQVFITVVGSSDSEAQKLADQEARTKAFNLICQEPFMPRPLTDMGKKEVRKLVDSNGKLIKLVKESDNTWSAVLQVQKENLRAHLQQIR